MSRLSLLLVLFVTFTFINIPALSEAGNAKLLPEGKARLRVFLTNGSADGKFDNSGNKQSFADLGADGDFTFSQYDVTFEFGYSDDLSLGLWSSYQNVAFDSQVAAADVSASGIGDTLIGFKSRLLGPNDAKLRIAWAAGLRAPTGQVDDPLNSNDTSLGDGQWDVALWFYLDYVVNDSFMVTILTRHEYQLPSDKRMINPSDSTERLKMEFQPGIYNRIAVRPQYVVPYDKFNMIYSLRIMYETEGKMKQQDYDSAAGKYSSDMSPVDGTDMTSLTLNPRIGVNMFKSGYPVIAYLLYSHMMQGKNTMAQSYFQLRFDIFFGMMD